LKNGRNLRVLKGELLCEAPMGEIGYVDFDDTVFLGQRIMQYRVNVTQLDSKFLLYSFLSPALQNQFRMKKWFCRKSHKGAIV
jgi:type I restriction enzyme S subunit